MPEYGEVIRLARASRSFGLREENGPYGLVASAARGLRRYHAEGVRSNGCTPMRRRFTAREPLSSGALFNADSSSIVPRLPAAVRRMSGELIFSSRRPQLRELGRTPPERTIVTGHDLYTFAAPSIPGEPRTALFRGCRGALRGFQRRRGVACVDAPRAKSCCARTLRARTRRRDSQRRHPAFARAGRDGRREARAGWAEPDEAALNSSRRSAIASNESTVLRPLPPCGGSSARASVRGGALARGRSDG